MRAERNPRCKALLTRGGRCLILIGCVAAFSGWAGPPLDTTDPLTFFTNVSARLLKSQLNLDWGRVQVYPTNQYTPAVHRLLQVAANLYDATTNRTNTGYPFCPSVFRPIFRRDAATNVFIAGYEEVTDLSLANPDPKSGGVPIVHLDPSGVMTIPRLGSTPFSSEPLVSGVPLVIGARKGFPNFNEFSMQTYFYVSRLLEFRRETINGPVTETNQMFVVAITNALGCEAWNSYSNAYPRNLQLTAVAEMTATLTNEQGAALFSNRVARGVLTNLAANSWPGWSSLPNVQGSFVLPFGTGNGFQFLTNSTYLNQPPFFQPVTHVFTEQAGFYVPRWWLTLKTELRFILADTNAGRIVDYVNLEDGGQTIDLTAKLMEGANWSASYDYNNPGNQWITNRINDSTDPSVPTRGVISQILAGLNGTTDSRNFVLDPYAGLDMHKAVDAFRYNLKGYTPVYPEDQGLTFYRSNVFYAPLDPYRPVFIHTSWQANDPLVHYMVYDLSDGPWRQTTNQVNFVPANPALPNLGSINFRYQPWGGNPFASSSTLFPFEIAAKDPLVTRSDNWDFPTGNPRSLGWLGRIHRGTPWQTLYLKSKDLLLTGGGNATKNLSDWQTWTGNAVMDFSQDGSRRFVINAAFTLPTNDWRLASMLVALLTTNDVRGLPSVNQTGTPAWGGLLNGLIALTNPAPLELQPLTISSNSSQAGIVAAAIGTARESQPRQVFQEPGDILATPELSMNSPWLTTSNTPPDGAYEILPSQLLWLVRSDSVGTIAGNAAGLQLRFTGYDGYAYQVETSTNLVDWLQVTTAFPTNGVFDFEQSAPPEIPVRFYRSELVR